MQSKYFVIILSSSCSSMPSVLPVNHRFTKLSHFVPVLLLLFVVNVSAEKSLAFISLAFF